MFKCDQCVSTFTRKDNLVAHQKKHDGVRFSCTICSKLFNQKSNLNRHNKNVHNITHNHSPRKNIIKSTPQTIVSNTQEEPSNQCQTIQNAHNLLDNDNVCKEALIEFENADLDETIQDSYTTTVNGKRISTANSTSAVKAKKVRMELVRSPGLIEISTSANRKIVWYYDKNIDKVQNYNIFLKSLKSDLLNILETHVEKALSNLI